MVSEPIYGLCDMLFTEFVILDQNILAANFNSIDLRHLTQHLSVSIKTFYSSANHFHSEVVRTAEPHLKQVCISSVDNFYDWERRARIQNSFVKPGSPVQGLIADLLNLLYQRATERM